MHEFWNFAGSYWWLVFPLLGVGSAIARTWERSARDRHKRRLETMHAKAEIKAAEAQARTEARIARTKPKPAVDAAPAAAAQAVDSTEQALQRLFDAHDEVTHRWLDYELDVAKLIAFPAMSDGRQPLTAAFLRARKVADRLRPASVKVKVTKEQLDEYRNAVTDFEVAFDVAERDARRLKDASFSQSERRRLDTAKQLLTVAVDQAATPAERQLAYKRVREELDGLISISDDAIEVLEKKVALQLPATAASSRVDAAPEPVVERAAQPRDETPLPAPEPEPEPMPVHHEGDRPAAGR